MQFTTRTAAFKPMIAERYRAEQELTRNAAIEKCQSKQLAVECYSGTGGLTKIYNRHFYQTISNDIEKSSPAEYHMDAMKFVEQVVAKIENKIDLIDFDCYGSPAYVIRKFFELVESKHCPIVVTLSDGLGIWMKRNSDVTKLESRYLLDLFQYDKRHPWRKHDKLIDHMFQMIATMYGMKSEKIVTVQTKGKNYILGSWLLS